VRASFSKKFLVRFINHGDYVKLCPMCRGKIVSTDLNRLGINSWKMVSKKLSFYCDVFCLLLTFVTLIMATIMMFSGLYVLQSQKKNEWMAGGVAGELQMAVQDSASCKGIQF
jgi:hypothetical protein